MKTTGICISVLSLIYLVFFNINHCNGQRGSNDSVIAGFAVPDTACVNRPIYIENLSQGATTYFWRFCSGNALTNPNGIDLGNPLNTLSAPRGITLAQDGLRFFAFVANSGDGTITRVYWTNGLTDSTPAAVNLGNFGILGQNIFGIQVKNDNGIWYGFVTNGTSLVRLDFGASLLNPAPLVTNVAALSDSIRGLVIEKDGNDWFGFSTNYWPETTVTRFHWVNSLSAIPAVLNLGNVGGLTIPMQPALIRDNTGWYLFIANTTSLSQLYFGNSLLNPPAGINLGNLGSMTDDRGLCLLMECNNPYGLIVNHNTVHNLLLQLHFNGGLGGTKAITPLGIISNLYLPSALSEAVITGDTIYTIAVNESTLTTLFFPPCTDAPIPPDTLFNPSPIVFTIPGTYTISLIIDLGLATEQHICKEIVIDTPKPFSLGNDTTICEGKGLVLTPGRGYEHYLWNTGDTSTTILVKQPGYYSVTVINFHDCEMADTIHVDVLQNQSVTVDTTICWGQKYLAGGILQSSSGTFFDTLALQYGCHKIVTTNLVVRPEVVVNVEGDTCLLTGNTLVLSAHVDGASEYTWQDGSHDSVFRVAIPGEYWVNVTMNKCSGSDTIHVKKCLEFTSFSLPTAFTPNGDGINDLFGPTGNNIVDFHMIIFDRWDQMLFETYNPEQGWDGKYKNKYCETGIYVFVVSYRNADNPGEVIRTKGNVTLVR